MAAPELMALIALCLSSASLALSLLLLLRDRDRLNAVTRFYPAQGGHPAWLEVEAVNEGRRPIVLVALVRDFADGSRASSPLREGKGIRLEQRQRFSEDIYITDPSFLCSEEGCAAIDLWFRDSLRRRHPIKGARYHLEQLIKSEASQGKGPEA